MKRTLIAILLCGLALVARPAAAQGTRFGLIVEGASGEEQYATMHRQWVDTLVTRDWQAGNTLPG